MMSSPSGAIHSQVAHVFAILNPGGAELRTIELVENTKFLFDFIAVSGQHGRLEKRLTDAGHRVTLIRLRVANFAKFVALMRKRKYRVVHSHLGLASGPVLLLAKVAGVPRRVAHFRSDAVGGRKSIVKSFYLWLSRALVQLLATDIVGVSPGSLEHGWCATWQRDPRCQVIPNGFNIVTLRNAAAIGRQTRTSQMAVLGIGVLNIGRPDAVKNRGRAIEIWERLSVESRSHLTLVGELNEADRSHIQGFRNDQRSAVDVVGHTERVAEYLGAADVLVSTSVREGLPGVVLEALAVGVPVVASRLPGTEWVESLLSGIELCELEDDDTSWVAAIRRSVHSNSNDITSAFDASPFTMKRSVESFLKLWQLSQ